MDPRVEKMVLWAWVGEDDTPGVENGEVGLKQANCPAGCIPMVACKEDKMDQEYIVDQMQTWVNFTHKPRHLVSIRVRPGGANHGTKWK